MSHEQDSKPEIPLGQYKHSKSGRLYELVGIARHSETLEWCVVYKSLYENQMADLWVRPAGMWNEEIELNGQRVPRFQPLDGLG